LCIRANLTKSRGCLPANPWSPVLQGVDQLRHGAHCLRPHHAKRVGDPLTTLRTLIAKGPGQGWDDVLVFLHVFEEIAELPLDLLEFEVLILSETRQ